MKTAHAEGNSAYGEVSESTFKANSSKYPGLANVQNGNFCGYLDRLTTACLNRHGFTANDGDLYCGQLLRAQRGCAPHQSAAEQEVSKNCNGDNTCATAQRYSGYLKALGFDQKERQSLYETGKGRFHAGLQSAKPAREFFEIYDAGGVKKVLERYSDALSKDDLPQAEAQKIASEVIAEIGHKPYGLQAELPDLKPPPSDVKYTVPDTYKPLNPNVEVRGGELHLKKQ
eukprot:TRINITY_DN2118_c0_g1_i1.p2 TRINITY_DN2118_c0_g1~~TRINITY_DN2118_c0_g1_i1.p2  ORF type:complete len:229 (+),score=76.89 TRINITY_DN2118_c0_g1_i1:158-844(+)